MQRAQRVGRVRVRRQHGGGAAAGGRRRQHPRARPAQPRLHPRRQVHRHAFRKPVSVCGSAWISCFVAVHQLESIFIFGGQFHIFRQVVDAGPLIDNMHCRRLENMRASEFSVSGTRKVSCVVSEADSTTISAPVFFILFERGRLLKQMHSCVCYTSNQ